MATIAEAAAHIDLNERRFRDLVTMGAIPKAEGYKQYDLDVVRISYIRHLRGIASGRAPLIRGDLDPLQERARKDKELADKTSLQNQVTRGELFSGAVVSKLVMDAFSKVRTRLFGLPTKLAPVVLHLETVPEVQAKLMDGVNDALAELSEQAVLAAAGTASVRRLDVVEDVGIIGEGGSNVGEEPFGDQPTPGRQSPRQGRTGKADVGRRAVAEPRGD